MKKKDFLSETGVPAKDAKATDAEEEIVVRDKRHWQRTDWDPADRSKTRYPQVVEQLKEQIHSGEQQLQKVREAARVVRDESEAFRKRIERDLDKKVSLGKESFFRDLLEVVDNLERCQQAAAQESQAVSEKSYGALVEGLRMVCQMMSDRLGRHGIRKVSVLNAPYCPETAEAIDLVETTDPSLDNCVVDVLQEGYWLEERLLRPARVRVAKAMKEAQETTREEGSEP